MLDDLGFGQLLPCLLGGRAGQDKEGVWKLVSLSQLSYLDKPGLGGGVRMSCALRGGPG